MTSWVCGIISWIWTFKHGKLIVFVTIWCVYDIIRLDSFCHCPVLVWKFHFVGPKNDELYRTNYKHYININWISILNFFFFMDIVFHHYFFMEKIIIWKKICQRKLLRRGKVHLTDVRHFIFYCFPTNMKPLPYSFYCVRLLSKIYFEIYGKRLVMFHKKNVRNGIPWMIDLVLVSLHIFNWNWNWNVIDHQPLHIRGDDVCDF